MSLEERRERGLKLIEEMLGEEKAQAALKHWQEICPEFGEYVTEFVAGEIWSRPGLDRRTKSLVSIGILAGIGRPRALELNIRFALNNGVTRQEITEALFQVAVYAGFPACWEALAAAANVFEEAEDNE